jgi:hypothetical protein
MPHHSTPRPLPSQGFDPGFWGPVFWRVLYYIEANPDQRFPKHLKLILAIVDCLPCRSCRNKAQLITSWMITNFHQLPTKNLVVMLHSLVNTDLGKLIKPKPATITIETDITKLLFILSLNYKPDFYNQYHYIFQSLLPEILAHNQRPPSLIYRPNRDDSSFRWLWQVIREKGTVGPVFDWLEKILLSYFEYWRVPS